MKGKSIRSRIKSLEVNKSGKRSSLERERGECIFAKIVQGQTTKDIKLPTCSPCAPKSNHVNPFVHNIISTNNSHNNNNSNRQMSLHHQHYQWVSQRKIPQTFPSKMQSAWDPFPEKQNAMLMLSVIRK